MVVSEAFRPSGTTHFFKQGVKRMTSTERKHQENLEKWTALVAECRSSELSCKDWCAQHEISVKQYHYWQKQILEVTDDRPEAAASDANEAAAPHFAELPALQPAPSPAGRMVASIQIGRASFMLYDGADPQMVAALVRELKSC